MKHNNRVLKDLYKGIKNGFQYVSMASRHLQYICGVCPASVITLAPHILQQRGHQISFVEDFGSRNSFLCLPSQVQIHIELFQKIVVFLRSCELKTKKIVHAVFFKKLFHSPLAACCKAFNLSATASSLKLIQQNLFHSSKRQVALLDSPTQLYDLWSHFCSVKS